MCTLEQAIKLEDGEVLKLLIELKSSMYFGESERAVANTIDVNIARRYLLTLILINDREKSGFEPVSEMNKESSKGDSPEDHRVDYDSFVDNLETIQRVSNQLEN